MPEGTEKRKKRSIRELIRKKKAVGLPERGLFVSF